MTHFLITDGNGTEVCRVPDEATTQDMVRIWNRTGSGRWTKPFTYREMNDEAAADDQREHASARA